MSKSTNNASAAFVGIALDMGWRLAVVVLVPVIGGHLLDEKLKSAPICIIIGFALALFGMVVVTRQTVRNVSEAGVDLAKPYKHPTPSDDEDDD